MKKIVFGITGLTIGGAERVLVDIANKLQEKYDITIFTIYGNGEFEKELNKNIKIVNLYKKSFQELTNIEKRIIPIKILKCGKQIYKNNIKGKYDIQIAFLEGPITRIFKYGDNQNKIVWIHNDISKVYGNNFKAKLKLILDKKIYKEYNQIIFVSNQNKEAFNNIFNKENYNNEKVIYNYINKNRILKLASKKEKIDFQSPSILLVSRLVKQKAIDRLIRIHKKLQQEGINNNIYIIGEGPEYNNLNKLIKDLNVENTFKLIGKKINPYPYMKKADYIALLSYFEGYGMVLEEAKILNKKILITDTAAKEAVSNYNKKIIIKNDENEIFEMLKIILKEDIKFNENLEEYNNEYIIEEIEKLLE